LSPQQSTLLGGEREGARQRDDHARPVVRWLLTNRAATEGRRQQALFDNVSGTERQEAIT